MAKERTEMNKFSSRRREKERERESSICDVIVLIDDARSWQSVTREGVRSMAAAGEKRALRHDYSRPVCLLRKRVAANCHETRENRGEVGGEGKGRGSCNMSREGRGERVDDNGSAVIRRLISSLGDTGVRRTWVRWWTRYADRRCKCEATPTYVSLLNLLPSATLL